jgi:hypothetical protein
MNYWSIFIHENNPVEKNSVSGESKKKNKRLQSASLSLGNSQENAKYKWRG